MRNIPFTPLLLTALEPEGKINENGVGVTLSPLSKEYNGNIYTYLLFKADSTAFQDYLKGIKGQKSTPSCCDIICFALQKSLDRHNKNKRKITICLVELKGGSKDQVSKASEQILETRDWLEIGIRRCIGDEGLDNITWKALIIDKSCTPKKNAIKNETYNKMRRKFNHKAWHIQQGAGDVNLVQYINEENQNTA